MSMMQLTGAGANPEGTFRYLGALERVPLPRLSDTCARFEQWCTPLLNETELRRTRELLERFTASRGAGEKLHAELEAYAAREGVYSWLDDFWSARYLGRRFPVSINANFAFLFKERDLTQLERAAELICAAVDFHLSLQKESLPVSMRRGQPLCMAEYKYLFSSTRIPGTMRDSVRAPFSEASPGASRARHILVLRRGHIYCLDVLDESGGAYSLSRIEEALAEIKHEAEAPLDDAQRVGYLTTLPRTDWAQVRQDLLSVAGNTERVDCIEEALFCVCLDEASGPGRKQAADEVLAGDGGNRWFDKSISFVVLADGVAGINVEHSGLDGTVVVEFVDYLHDSALLARLRAECDHRPGKPAYRPLQFELGDDPRAQVLRAKRGFEALKANTATHYFTFDDFGTDRIRAFKMSPDAFLQLAFQWAHLQTKGLNGATYESVATRQFERGRTEAMRVLTSASQGFVAAMNDPGANRDVRVATFRAAAEAHVNRARDCQAGQAPEQHLWQLQMLAQERGEALGIDPEDLALFESPGWLKMRDDYLSTSSAPSDNVTVFGFGATSEQCIGIAYLPRQGAIHAYLSTPAPVADEMVRFAHNLGVALRELGALMAGEEETRDAG